MSILVVEMKIASFALDHYSGILRGRNPEKTISTALTTIFMIARSSLSVRCLSYERPRFYARRRYAATV